MAPSAPNPDDYRFLLENKPFWRDFLDQIKDRFSPNRVPELVLESKPIPVKDIWAKPETKRSLLSVTLFELAVVGILCLPFWRPVRKALQETIITPIFVPAQPAPIMPKMLRLSGGGGPVHTVAPKLVQQKVQAMSAPTALMPLADVLNSPSFGAIGPISGPPGAGGGSGGGPGGNGSGGEGGNCIGANCGGGVGITQPIPIYDPDPEYSDAARKAKFQGTCTVQVVIGADGTVSHPTVVEPLGLGLDQKAIEAVLKWRFRPARDKDGRPVAVTANIEVNFRLY